LAASTIAAALFFVVYPEKVMRYANYESTFYRVEGVPAAIEIMKQHPWMGIGIRTPRREYLEHFIPPFGSADKETFLSVVDVNVTSDNQYLSLPIGIGIPFALLYFGLIGNKLLACLRRSKRGGLDSGTERALAFALLATLAHFFIYDGLFYPQISWFFHLLLGVGIYSSKPLAESCPSC
jgi:O-antigen ligase